MPRIKPEIILRKLDGFFIFVLVKVKSTIAGVAKIAAKINKLSV